MEFFHFTAFFWIIFLLIHIITFVGLLAIALCIVILVVALGFKYTALSYIIIYSNDTTPLYMFYKTITMAYFHFFPGLYAIVVMNFTFMYYYKFMIHCYYFSLNS